MTCSNGRTFTVGYQDRSFYISVGENEKLILSTDEESAARFKIDGDQLKHTDSGKYVHPMHGKKYNGVELCLQGGYDGDRTCCYPFDFHRVNCLIAGGDSYFLEPNIDSMTLSWFKYYNDKDTASPFVPKYKFEFIPKGNEVSRKGDPFFVHVQIIFILGEISTKQCWVCEVL